MLAARCGWKHVPPSWRRDVQSGTPRAFRSVMSSDRKVYSEPSAFSSLTIQKVFARLHCICRMFQKCNNRRCSSKQEKFSRLSYRGCAWLKIVGGDYSARARYCRQQEHRRIISSATALTVLVGHQCPNSTSGFVPGSWGQLGELRSFGKHWWSSTDVPPSQRRRFWTRY